MLPALKFFDGAFGTYYFNISRDDQPCELANLQKPHIVERIHREYMAAGAQAIKTNTYSANSSLFEDKELRNRVIQAGFALAGRAVEGTSVQVFADIGYIRGEQEETQQEYLELAELFVHLGAKNFLFETMAEYAPAEKAAAYIRQAVPDSCILFSFAVSQDGYSKKGLYYKTLLALAQENPAIDGVGLNCQCGPSHMLGLIRQLDFLTKPLLAMPNSGYPSSVGGRTVFQDNADYFAQKLTEILEGGASLAGGCCGTTPEHIRMAVLAWEKREGEESQAKNNPIREKAAPNSAAGSLSSLCRGRKLIAVELDPPVKPDCAFLLDAARRLSGEGADIITIADSPLAKTRADSIMTAAKIKRETGVEVLPHLSCRDKNHIAIKGLLLGASFEQIDKVLAITGDPIMEDVLSGGKGVFSFNSFGLISYIRSMNEEVFRNRPFSVGGALNVNAGNFPIELSRARKKLEMGASFLLTQPIFTQQAAKNLRLARKELDCVLLAGVLPAASYRNALFLNNEVTGITIPQQVLDSLKDKQPEEVLEISAAYTLDIMKQVRDDCDGYYIMTPLKKVELVCKLLKGLREWEK